MSKKSESIYEGWFGYTVFAYIMLNYVLHIDVGLISTVFIVFLGIWTMEFINNKKESEEQYKRDNRDFLEEGRPRRYFNGGRRVLNKKEKTVLYDERELI